LSVGDQIESMRPIVMVRGAAGACAETTVNETVRRTQMRARERMVASG